MEITKNAVKLPKQSSVKFAVAPKQIQHFAVLINFSFEIADNSKQNWYK